LGIKLKLLQHWLPRFQAGISIHANKTNHNYPDL
jgi:hypothetical protein